MMTVADSSATRKPVVAVLLATYNGVPWVKQQVADILGQDNVSIRMFVSDDMSSDGTWDWLCELAGADKRVILLPRGERFGGAARNFFRLLRDADLDGVDFVALADQDDIWLSGKLARAASLLDQGGYLAYSGNVTAFWPDGRRALIDKAQPQCRFDYLFEAAGPGCTYVLSAKAAYAFREFLATRWVDINEVSLHDWLIYAWCRASRIPWFIDNQPMLEYRQHGQNQFGANKGWGALKARLLMMRTGWYRGEIRKIARLVAGNGEWLPDSLVTSGAVPRLFLIRHFAQVRRRLRDRVFFFFSVMLGIY